MALLFGCRGLKEKPTQSPDGIVERMLLAVKNDERKFFMDSIACPHSPYATRHGTYGILRYIGADYQIGSHNQVNPDSIVYHITYRRNNYSREVFPSQATLSADGLDSLPIDVVFETGKWMISLTEPE